jgi:cold shock CspA family protein
MTETGSVAWFDLAKQLGFVVLNNDHRDAFLHMSVL